MACTTYKVAKIVDAAALVASVDEMKLARSNGHRLRALAPAGTRRRPLARLDKLHATMDQDQSAAASALKKVQLGNSDLLVSVACIGTAVCGRSVTACGQTRLLAHHTWHIWYEWCTSSPMCVEIASIAATAYPIRILHILDSCARLIARPSTQMMGSVNTEEEAVAQLDHYRSALSASTGLVYLHHAMNKSATFPLC